MTEKERQLLSPHFKLYELIRSGVAIENDIPNMPSDEQVAALAALARNVLEPLCQRFGPILISSGYRCERVNRLVGGARNSQHLRGEAADIVIGNVERGVSLYRFIRDRLDFDQLIWEPMGADEPRWLHVSYTMRRRNRKVMM